MNIHGKNPNQSPDHPEVWMPTESKPDHSESVRNGDLSRRHPEPQVPHVCVHNSSANCHPLRPPTCPKGPCTMGLQHSGPQFSPSKKKAKENLSPGLQ